MIKLRRSLSDSDLIKNISRELSVSERFAKILAVRGITDIKSAKSFLNPTLKDIADPLSMYGINEAVKRIKEAKDNGETVVVYGDYDADGISATTILTRSLKIFGVTVFAVVPERDDGYGLSEEMIEKVAEEYCPDLLITVDCGISGAQEVEYLKDIGIDVIITDHHELPEKLPECIVVNCKIDDGATFKWLCGAGVAYKLSYALIGDKANDFLDIVAVATLADSMPVTGENRALICEGLKKISNGKCCRIIKELIKLSQVKEISSTSIAYILAPRINAAGRMGDASTALRAFLADDEFEIVELAAKLNSYNVSRQNECDALYKSAKFKLAEKSPVSKVIVLADKSWKSGLVGIVAARLAEETGKPAILFTEKNGLWHGSARSVAAVNIFEALKSVSDITESFGGHTQAAGVTITEENINKFELTLNDYISKHCDLKAFLAPLEVDEITDSPIDINYAEELELLEPCGTDNPKPSFAVYINNAYASPIKYGSPHISFKTDFIDMMYFNGIDKMKFLNAPIPKAVIFEPAVSVFNGRKNVKGYVRNVLCDTENNEYVNGIVFSSQLDGCFDGFKFTDIDSFRAQELIYKTQDEVYGTIFVINNPSNIGRFDGLDLFERSVLFPSDKSNLNCVCYGLKGEVPAHYSKVIYLDKPFGITATFSENTEVYVNCELNGLNIDNVSVDRETLGKIYVALKNSRRSFCDIKDFYDFSGGNFNIKQIGFTLKVFKELGLIKFENGKFYAVNGIKCELNQSAIYRRLRGVIEV